MHGEYILEKFATGMHYFMLDKEAAKALLREGNKRAICLINNEIEFHCAIMSTKHGEHFVNVGLTICKKLDLRKGSTLKASFSVHNTTYQFEMPEEMQEVLDTDQDALKIFQSLTKGNQRSLIYLVTQVKSTDKKIERAIKIVNQLKKGICSPKLILK
jgi:hypothetical protein